MLSYDFLVFLNHSFNKPYFRRFQSIILHEFYRKQRELRPLFTLYDMNMYRLMVVRIEHETETEESEYLWHKNFILIIPQR